LSNSLYKQCCSGPGPWSPSVGLVGLTDHWCLVARGSEDSSAKLALAKARAALIVSQTVTQGRVLLKAGRILLKRYYYSAALIILGINSSYSGIWGKFN